MQTYTSCVRHCGGPLVATLALAVLMGCQSQPDQSHSTTPAPAAATVSPAAPPQATAPATATVQPKAAPGVIRIRAGNTVSLTDSKGQEWLADQGFADGETTLRADGLKIENTMDPNLYRSEHYGMSAFSYPLPNGKYTVKLHFAETFEEISGPGQRVFSFSVNGKEFNDFDVWAKAGGGQRAYVEAVPVEITSGKLEIKFTPKVQNPEINGIEIIPAS